MMRIGFSMLETLTTPMFWVNPQGYIDWRNESALQLVHLNQDNLLWIDVCNRLPKGYIYRLHENILDDKLGILVECIPDSNPELIYEVQRLQSTNEELEKIFDASFDEVFVTDGSGITLRVNEAVERLYGLRKDELIGKSVFELERRRIYYPSVVARVLKEKKRLTIIQTTRDGRRLIATANPVFDPMGNVIQVISNAKDISEIPLTPEQTKIFLGLGGSSISGSSISNHFTDDELVAESPATRNVLALVEKVKNTETSLLLLGETGVGKNRLAELLHQLSYRHKGAFVCIDCASIPETLLESELFGYEKGAFTGANREGKLGSVELADSGTLFLDEIGEIPLHLQGKLLRFLQQRTFTRIGGTRVISVNTRIIAATNRDLEQMVAKGQFRADLYYRLNVVPIFVPPLRERRGDIMVIAKILLSKFAKKYSLPTKHIHSETVKYFESYEWPGNIRQLENIVERLFITVDEATIMPEHLPPAMTASSHMHPPSDGHVMESIQTTSFRFQGTLHEKVAQFERLIFEKAIREFPSTYAIAKELEVSQPTVVRKLKQYGLR